MKACEKHSEREGARQQARENGRKRRRAQTHFDSGSHAVHRTCALATAAATTRTRRSMVKFLITLYTPRCVRVIILSQKVFVLFSFHRVGSVSAFPIFAVTPQEGVA
jgi:hypothetical protein